MEKEKGKGCTYSEDIIYQTSTGEMKSVTKGTRLTIMEEYTNNLTILRWGNRLFFAETTKIIKDV